MEGEKVVVDIRFKNNARCGLVHIIHESLGGRLTKSVPIANGAAALLLQFDATALLLLLLSNQASNSGSNNQARKHLWSCQCTK